MKLPQFTAEAAMNHTSGPYASGERAPNNTSFTSGNLLAAGLYKCGVDCKCDPGQCCYEKTFSCSCGPCAAVSRRVTDPVFLTR